MGQRATTYRAVQAGSTGQVELVQKPSRSPRQVMFEYV